MHTPRRGLPRPSSRNSGLRGRGERAQGATTWYWHLKRGSVTEKAIGTVVQQGEYLGVVGSSGSSTGPHTHFEVRDPDEDLIDPYAGSCNEQGSFSGWSEQPPYFGSATNKLAAHRIFLRFAEKDIARGGTIVAVRTL